MQVLTGEQAKYLLERFGAQMSNKVKYFAVESLLKGGGYETNSKFEGSDELDVLETILDTFKSEGKETCRILIRPYDPSDRRFRLVNGHRIY